MNNGLEMTDILTKKGDNLFVHGIQKDPSPGQLSLAIEKVFLKASDNLSWLSKGDLVLLKPALNSPDLYPATTHPLSLKVVSEILEKHGAEVIAGDQSGIEHVLQDESGVIHGSSKGCFEKSGMAESGVKFVSFEDEGWDGFYKFKSMKTSSWKDGFYITKLVKEADHIINLPRLSTHILAGVTLGFKDMVGLLREDSRVQFHTDGPFSFGLTKMLTRKSSLKKDYPKENLFFEKITEISSALEKKLRLTLFTGTEAQVTIGPDRRTVPLISSIAVKPETGLVFASSDQVAAEIFAISFLTLLYSKAPLNHKLIHKIFIKLNGHIKELGTESVWGNPFVRHALKIGLGTKSFKTNYVDVPDELKFELNGIYSTGENE